MAGRNGGGPRQRPGPVEYVVAVFIAVVLVLALIGLASLILRSP